MTQAQSFSYSAAGIVLADLNLESMADDSNHAAFSHARVLATQNDSNIPAELLSPTSSIDSQDLSQHSSSSSIGAVVEDLPPVPGSSGKRSAPYQSSKNSKTKKTDHDPVETAILDLVQSRKNEPSKPELTSEEHFYLSIAKDVMSLDIVSRLQMRQAVLSAFVGIMKTQYQN